MRRALMFSISAAACAPSHTASAPRPEATVAIHEPSAPRAAPRAPSEPTGPVPLVMRTDTRRMTHGDGVTALALTGDRVISAAGETIHIWDRESGLETRAIVHSERVRGLLVLADGEHMAVARDDTIQLLDLDGAIERSSKVKSTVQATALSPNGERIAVIHYTGVALLDAKTLAPIATLDGEGSPGDELTFVGDEAVAFGRRGAVKLWRPGHAPSELTGPSEYLSAVAASVDGERIAACADDKLYVWRADTTLAWQADAKYCGAVAFSPDGQYLAGAVGFGDITLWDPRTGTPYQGLYGHQSGVTALRFTGDGALLSASSDHTVREWDILTAKERHPRRGHREKVTSVALFAKARELLSTSKQLFRWRIDDPTEPRELPSTGYFSRGCVAVSPDEKLAARASDTVDLIDLNTGKLLRKVSDSHLGCHAMAFSPDGAHLAVLGDQELSVFAVDDATAAPLSWGGDAYLGGLAYAPDGKRLALGVHEKGVLLLDAADLTEVGWLPGGESHTSVAFSPDGKRVAAGDLRHVWLWDTSAPKQNPWDIAHPGGWVRAVRFVPRTQLLAYGGDGGRVHLWQLDARTELVSFEAHRHALTSIDVSGWRLATGGADLTAAVWALDALDLKGPGSLSDPRD